VLFKVASNFNHSLCCGTITTKGKAFDAAINSCCIPVKYTSKSHTSTLILYISLLTATEISAIYERISRLTTVFTLKTMTPYTKLHIPFSLIILVLIGFGGGAGDGKKACARLHA
jgi:hypothetical protein